MPTPENPSQEILARFEVNFTEAFESLGDQTDIVPDGPFFVLLAAIRQNAELASEIIDSALSIKRRLWDCCHQNELEEFNDKAWLIKLAVALAQRPRERDTEAECTAIAEEMRRAARPSIAVWEAATETSDAGGTAEKPPPEEDAK
ncbi:hypothetical protein HZC21_02715 [Candidatus Peregrinibacteria bacterium]|nr:hypothetical protein [Candidatus Peregrinibacteria bacterium]